MMGAETMNQTWDLCIYSWTNIQLLEFVILPPPSMTVPTQGPKTETEASLQLELLA